MSETDALAAQAISEAIDMLVDELTANEANITAGMILALGRRLADQARTRVGARAAVEMVTEHVEAVVELHMEQKLGPK